MAQSNTPSTDEYATDEYEISPPPQDSFAAPLTVNDIEPESEDPDEWEYAYSTTETETYYVTLDLTTPDIKPRLRKGPYGGNRHIKAKWLSPGMERAEPKRGYMGKPNAKEETETPAESKTTPRPDADDLDDDAQFMLEDSASREEDNDGETAAAAAKVQILDLHSRNPIVSYRGHVYSCQWASNVGTELLFTEHDPNSALPVLRNLAGNVDLLAASSCRIISRSLVLESKAQKFKNGENRSGNDPSLSIPVGNQASDRRKGQARFLERLMEIKEAKGEDDDVTVYTQTKLSNRGWQKYMTRKIQEERARMLKIVKAGGGRKGNLETAKQRLVELDAEEAKMKEAEKKSLEKSKVRGRKKRGVGDSALDGESPRKKARMGKGVDQETLHGESGSPWAWQDEEDDSGEDMDEVMMQDDERMEEELYDEEIYGDEDPSGEDEDV